MAMWSWCSTWKSEFLGQVELWPLAGVVLSNFRFNFNLLAALSYNQLVCLPSGGIVNICFC